MATPRFSIGTMPQQPPSTFFGNSLGPSLVPAVGPGTIAYGGGGLPGISTLTLGGDLSMTDYRSIHIDNLATLELPVSSGIVSVVEELKNQMKNHKQAMMPLTISTEEDKLFNCVIEKIAEVDLSIQNLSNLIHQLTVQSSLLIKDKKKVKPNLDFICQACEIGSGPLSSSCSCTTGYVNSFLIDLVANYQKQLDKYKGGCEKAEMDLQGIQGTLNTNDLWNSLTAIKDTVVFLACQVQHLEKQLKKGIQPFNSLLKI